MQDRRIKKFNCILGILLLSYYVTACAQKNNPFTQNFTQNGNAPINVEVIKIKPLSLNETINTTGELQSPESIEITSDVNGKITYLNIPEGTEVNKGYVLAQVEDDTIQADLKINEAKYNNAKTNFKRIESLKEQGAVSQQVFDNALETLNTTLGEVERTKSVLHRTKIQTPFSGIFSLKKISLGSYISSGDTIVRLTKINPLHLIFSVPEKYLHDVNVGQEINFIISASKKAYKAKIAVLDPYVDPDTRSVRIQAIVFNSNKELRPGNFADINIITMSKQNRLLLPEEALIQENDKKFVFKVSNKKHKVFKKEVKIGIWNDGIVEIVNGLKPEDLIITSGYQKVKDGSIVNITNYQKILNPYLRKNSTN